jgi:hypothetical protein
MRTICREIGKGNTIQYISRRHFLDLEDDERTHLIERPLVITADASDDESQYI